ncbi:PadR family transcriptional regulator [Acidithiobacillus thiooxidans]|uniref:PadR family transcriptional regulator n=1 Tax=Acidithiobacillus TaxID=119977 RepID=UPI0004E10F0C|nr:MULTISPECIES: PadR family transcriptional regulator [Acidithiobacillus]MBE7562653.1 PadR family transcriptional regulator [Acidithiobacillus sp. HP-6]MBE7567929.1 PadR family transcriptional regulator [Acidithiobacillus sp. HP-11]MBE7568288.1 PadR family transcriptional regulator [Acidithiobacillus sp. HP-2]MBU2743026.1 PadR family transcriptional regulator [Acidithiobacillus albertensis]MBU2750653.1 PadR family transcriptional regulator [Acidithiobacillus thiooxidans]
MRPKESNRQGRHLASFALLLCAEAPAHGLALHRSINELLPEGLTVDAGNLYRLLREMEARGTLRSEWSTVGSGAARRVYQITPAGLDELAEWREDIARRRQAFDLFIQRYDALPVRNTRTLKESAR